MFSLSLSSQLTKSEYVVAIFGAVGIFLSIYTLVFVVSCVLIFKTHPAPSQGIPIHDGDVNTLPVESGDANEATGKIIVLLVPLYSQL